ncbi:hypothetical protein F4808DRAFT_278706 [Astrocystis sublimbata]|nr:hypothetical protein F4808DRAFT_278706 [Astrocystis sublimbata]
MASEPAMPPASPASPAAAAGEQPEKFTLQIVSPSAHVAQPLTMALPITTTVQQLKALIRSCVDTCPPDEAQRLIYRGRLLSRESQTMVELFGDESLRSAGPHAIHLVLRDPPYGQSTAASPNPHSPLASRSQTPSQQHNNAHLQTQPQQPVQNVRFDSQPTISNGNTQAPGPPTGPFHPPGMMPPAQDENQTLRRLTQIREHHIAIARGASQNQHSAFTAFSPRDQRDMWGRASLGTTTPGRAASPLHPETTRPVIYENVDNNGRRWRCVVRENSVTTQLRRERDGSLHPSAILPDPLRPFAADSTTPNIAVAMPSNASNSSLPSLASGDSQHPFAPPRVAISSIVAEDGSAAGTPDPLRAMGRSASVLAGATPEVYILSSPNGPQAILLNGSSGIYHSPQLRSYETISQVAGLPPPPTFASFISGHTEHVRREAFPQIIARPSIAARNTPNPNPPRVPPPQLRPQHAMHVPGPMHAHGLDNAQVRAVRMIQVWPHIWMIIRLALFIWWFTSPTSSWSRWFTVVSIAIALFVVNTGVLNPLAEQIWNPLRRHLENLIPLAADGRQRQRPGAENAPGGNADGVNPGGLRNLDPAAAAARLVQHRQQNNANWLFNQARRLERAGILFIASLAPGLAERHIAQVEADARAERQRQEEADAAAAAAAQAASEQVAEPGEKDSSEGHGAPAGDGSLGNEAGPSNAATGQGEKAPAREESHAE